MVFILIGVLLGLCVEAYTWFSPDEDDAQQVFADNIEFKGSVFFFVLLPPIILDGGYNMKKARFFRNIDRIVVFAIIGTLISTSIIGAMYAARVSPPSPPPPPFFLLHARLVYFLHVTMAY